TERQQQVTRPGVISSRRQCRGVRKREELSDVSIRVVHGLAKVVPSELLVKFEKTARVEGARWVVELLFKISRDLWSARRKDEIELAVFPDSLSRAVEKNLVFHKWTTQGDAAVPTLEKRHVGTVRIIRRVEGIVSKKYRRHPMIIVSATLGDHVDDRACR